MKKFLALLLVALLTCSLFVACDFFGNEEESSSTTEVTYDLEGAAEYVKGLYKDDLNITSVDYSVVSQVMVAGVTYQIDWAVDSDKVTVGEPADGKVVIGVDEKSPEEVAYKLTATIKAGDGTSTTVTFNLTVPLYEAVSHEEYMAAESERLQNVMFEKKKPNAFSMMAAFLHNSDAREIDAAQMDELQKIIEKKKSWMTN